MRRIVLLLALPLVLLTALPSSAFTIVGVSIDNAGANGFNPTTLTIGRADQVRWTNNDDVSHDVTMNGGVFVSNTLAQGQASGYKAFSAGKYPYHCSIHPSMKGTVIVPLGRSPASGPSGTTFTLTIDNENGVADNRVFDVRRMQPGEPTFSLWKNDITTRTVSFVLTTPGTYQFKARQEQLAVGGASSYSDVVSITVT